VTSAAKQERPLRVGIDARELQGRATGVGRYLRGLLRHWPREDTLFLYFNGPAPDAAIAAAAPSRLRPSNGRPVAGIFWQERFLPRATRIDAVDVLFSPAYSCPLSLALPRVTTVHDLSFFSLPDDFTVLDGLRRRLLVGASIRASRRIVVVSDFTRREIASRFPDVADRIRVVAHGSDDDIPAAAGVREPHRLLAVGSILNRRHLPALLAAVARLRRAYCDVHLDVVGDNRTHPRIDVARRLRGLGIEDRVAISGFLTDEDLAARYALAGVAVYLSEYEGFGMPVVEAMARGIPVVTSTRPATGEIFREAALTVAPDDAGAVAGALGRLFDDDALRADLVARGRQLTSTLTWARAAASTRRVLAEAAA
jgi:glycosyltransferase involved in cell wall biosynthesis